jgi:flagellum-specific peptidoglycan hydrolase FlgJ
VFDFKPLDDLQLTSDEMMAIAVMFPKIQNHINQSFWAETPQQLTENFVRELSVCRAENCLSVAAVVAAQGILESGWFSTRSMFGVKATVFQKEHGQYANEATHEDDPNGVTIPIVDAFFETPSVQNNFANYFNYLTRRKSGIDRFAPADIDGYLAALQDPNFAIIQVNGRKEGTGSYSTAGDKYVATIKQIIADNRLEAFNRAA